ncbi:rhodanese-like domain-containing protein [Pontibacter sp. CAU 1760]
MLNFDSLKKKLYIATALLCLLAGGLYAQTTDKAYALMLQGMYGRQVPLLMPTQLQQQLQSSAVAPLLLDTRTQAEYNVSHLAGAKLVAYDQFDVKRLRGISKQTPIVVYCSVGYRSERIGEKLQKAGFENVQNLYGGIFEWVNQGYAVYNSAGKTNQVHAYSRTWGIWLRKGEKIYE